MYLDLSVVWRNIYQLTAVYNVTFWHWAGLERYKFVIHWPHIVVTSTVSVFILWTWPRPATCHYLEVWKKHLCVTDIILKVEKASEKCMGNDIPIISSWFWLEQKSSALFFVLFFPPNTLPVVYSMSCQILASYADTHTHTHTSAHTHTRKHRYLSIPIGHPPAVLHLICWHFLFSSD